MNLAPELDAICTELRSRITKKEWFQIYDYAINSKDFGFLFVN